MTTGREVKEAFAELRDGLSALLRSGRFVDADEREQLRRLHLVVATALRSFHEQPSHGEESALYEVPLEEARQANLALERAGPAALAELRAETFQAVDSLRGVTGVAPRMMATAGGLIASAVAGAAVAAGIALSFAAFGRRSAAPHEAP